jgi:hypothetical protein
VALDANGLRAFRNPRLRRGRTRHHSVLGAGWRWPGPREPPDRGCSNQCVTVPGSNALYRSSRRSAATPDHELHLRA